MPWLMSNGKEPFLNGMDCLCDKDQRWAACRQTNNNFLCHASKNLRRLEHGLLNENRYLKPGEWTKREMALDAY
jgi:hypothetical protein